MYVTNKSLTTKIIKKYLNFKKPAMSLFRRGLGIGPLGPGGTSSLENILY